MKDKTLSVDGYLPAAGATLNTDLIDLQTEGTSPGNNWRLGRLKVKVGAAVNHTDATKTITATLQDSADGGATFAETVPTIQGKLIGVAVNGSVETVIDFPLPPSLRGPVRVALTVPAGDGDNTGVPVNVDWVNE